MGACAGRSGARIPPDEFDASDKIAKADPRVVEALAKRGITDLDTVLIETWAPGNFGIEGEEASASPTATAG